MFNFPARSPDLQLGALACMAALLLTPPEDPRAAKVCRKVIKESLCLFAICHLVNDDKNSLDILELFRFEEIVRLSASFPPVYQGQGYQNGSNTSTGLSKFRLVVEPLLSWFGFFLLHRQGLNSQLQPSPRGWGAYVANNDTRPIHP